MFSACDSNNNKLDELEQKIEVIQTDIKEMKNNQRSHLITYDYSDLSLIFNGSDFSSLVDLKDYFSNYKTEESLLVGDWINLPKLTISDGFGEIEWYIEGTNYVINENQEIGRDITLKARWLTKPTTALIKDGVVRVGRIGDDYTSFAKWDNLKSVILSSSVEYIGYSTFNYCIDLSSVTFSMGQSNLKKIEAHAFTRCSKLTSIYLPESLEEIEGYAFSYSGLTSITIPKNVYFISAENPFLGCKDLERINVNAENVMYTSPNNCNAIIFNDTLIVGCKNTIIPNGVTTIYKNAFYGQEDLENLNLPNSITEIGSEAFRDCDNLQYLILPSIISEVYDDSFRYSYIDLFYEGSSQMFNQVGIFTRAFNGVDTVDQISDTREFESASLYFYSELKPAEEGNFWHYDTDGVTPIVWEE